ncbi:xylulokinase [Nakamurella panacisegetis]|uniref:Xylulokinase n=2 Tax=Nakamurella panacisegetis TaxID=1090615 RepID=A0A1H0M1N2_9ACTN|nr:xylulokinase [Nakamurella panacisegetis]
MSTACVLLGIDLGTSSVKVVLTDRVGTVLAQASAEYPVDRPHPGWAETDPEAWWRAIRTAVAQVLAAGPGVAPAGVGLSGQMHGVVVCLADATPARPAVLWADSRAEDELDVYRALPAAARARLANPLSPGMAGPELAWLHRHEPRVMAGARWALQPKDWIRARLTGEFAAEPSDACATLLYDVTARTWDAEVVAALGIRPELLPELLPFSGVAAGSLLPSVAAELGLPPGIPVSAGAGDSAAAALGSGVLDPGTVQLTIGTGVQIVTVVEAPTLETVGHRHDPVTHLYRSATRDGWYAMAAGLTGGQSLDWVRRLLGAEWAELYAAADRGPQDGDPIFLPHLVGERTPYLDTHLRGSWTGLDARHDRTALLYSALEGVAFAAADGLDALPGVPDADRHLRLAGGGTVSPGWRALLANALNAHLHAVDVPGASARGAGLLAAQAAGWITDAELVEVARPHTTLIASPGPGADALRDRRRLYLDTLRALRPLRSR